MKQKLISASIWTGSAFAVSRGLQLISNLVLTRLLYPEAFGLMVIVNIFIIGLSLLSDIGLRASGIQNERGAERSFLLTIWSIRVFRSLGIFLIACLAAWPVSILYKEPLLFPLICVCSIRVILDGLNSIRVLVAERELDLKKFAFLQITTQCVAFFSTCTMAYIYSSVWVLAFGSITSSLAQLVLSHHLFPYKHKFTFDRSAAHSIFNFGKWIFFSTLLTFIGGKGLDGIKGLMVTTEMLSLLFIAAMLASAIVDGYRVLTTQIIFPYLSNLNRNNNDNYPRLFAKVRYLSLPPVVLILVCISIFSKDLIEVLYDARYIEVGSLLAIGAINAALACQNILYIEGAVAQGNSKMYFTQMLFLVPVLIVMSLGGLYWYGVYGMLLAEGVVSIWGFAFCYYQARKIGLAMPVLDLISMTCIAAGAWVSYIANF